MLLWSAVTRGGEVVSRGRTCEERLKVADKRTNCVWRVLKVNTKWEGGGLESAVD